MYHVGSRTVLVIDRQAIEERFSRMMERERQDILSYLQMRKEQQRKRLEEQEKRLAELFQQRMEDSAVELIKQRSAAFRVAEVLKRWEELIDFTFSFGEDDDFPTDLEIMAREEIKFLESVMDRFCNIQLI